MSDNKKIHPNSGSAQAASSCSTCGASPCICDVTAGTLRAMIMLEQMLVSGILIGYEIDRNAGQAAYVSLSWLEFDEDSPGGFPAGSHGYGVHIADAFAQAVRNMPRPLVRRASALQAQAVA